MAGAIPFLYISWLAGSVYGKAATSVGQTHLTRRKEEVPPVARVSVFNSPFLVGFDHFERVLTMFQRPKPTLIHPIISSKTATMNCVLRWPLRVLQCRSYQFRWKIISLPSAVNRMRTQIGIFCIAALPPDSFIATLRLLRAWKLVARP